MTAPLTPPDSDLRGLPFMPLDVVRLLDSDLFALSTGDEFKAAVALWCKCWLQLPAASLPNDDRILASLAGFGRDTRGWLKVKAMAMRGFILCDDGRWYHEVIAQKAIEAWGHRLKQRSKSAAGNAKRWNKSSSGEPNGEPQGDPRGDAHSDPHGDATRDRKGQGEGEIREEEPSGPSLAAKRRRQQIPLDFLPSPDGVQFATSRGVNVAEELQKFTDYHSAKGSVMLDWQAAWRTWANNAKTFARGSPQANKQVAVEQRNKSVLSDWVSRETQHA